VVSAGLGLIAADRPIPAYGMTIGGRGPESVREQVAGHFDAAAWWQSVSAGPFATPLASLFEDGSDLPVLVALTQPYAQMLAPSLEDLTDTAIRRVRIAGIDLARLLPKRVANQVLPYDGRLEAILPGTKADFPQRALFHFVKNGLAACPSGNATDHCRWVESALADQPAPERPVRPRLSDDEIVQLIERHLPEACGIGGLLRVLRDREGVACEQARFSRLYRAAVDQRAA